MSELLYDWELDDVRADVADLLIERCSIFRPDNNQVYPPTAQRTNVPCEVEQVQRLAAPSINAGGGNEPMPVRFEMRFVHGYDVDARDLIRITGRVSDAGTVIAYDPPRDYIVEGVRSPATFELFTFVDAVFQG